MDPLNEKGDGPGARRPGAGGLGRSEPDGKDGLGDSAQDRFYIPPDSSPIAKNPGKAAVRRMQKRREKRLRAERRERDALREQSLRRSSEEYLRVREAIKEEQRRDEQREQKRQTPWQHIVKADIKERYAHEKRERQSEEASQPFFIQIMQTSHRKKCCNMR